MFYLLQVIVLVLFFILGYTNKHFIKKFTNKHPEYNFISEVPQGRTRTNIFCITVWLSLILDVSIGISDIISFGSLTSITGYVRSIYGAGSSIEVFYVIQCFLICTGMFSFMRGLSLAILIKYGRDGYYTKYKYVKIFIKVLIFSLVLRVIYFINEIVFVETISSILNIENSYDADLKFVVYYISWLFCFIPLKHKYNLPENALPPQLKDSSNYIDKSSKTIENSSSLTQLNLFDNSNLQEEQPIHELERYLELKEEIKNFPVKKIKQWYAEGRLTEEQYKASARKYNAILKEIKEIKERLVISDSRGNSNE